MNWFVHYSAKGDHAKFRDIILQPNTETYSQIQKQSSWNHSHLGSCWLQCIFYLLESERIIQAVPRFPNWIQGVTTRLGNWRDRVAFESWLISKLIIDISCHVKSAFSFWKIQFTPRNTSVSVSISICVYFIPSTLHILSMYAQQSSQWTWMIHFYQYSVSFCLFTCRFASFTLIRQ